MPQLSPKVEKALREVIEQRAEILRMISRVAENIAAENLAVRKHVHEAEDGLFDVHDNGRVLRRFDDRESAESFVRDAWRKSFAHPEFEQRKAPPIPPEVLPADPGFKKKPGLRGARLDNVVHPPTTKRTRIL